MKKYFKYGVGLILPLALVASVLWWMYGMLADFVNFIKPGGLDYKWWFTVVLLVGIIIIIFLVGFVFKNSKPLRWIKNKIEKYTIERIPIVNKIYAFGKEISDSFIADVKGNGDLQVVEVSFGDFKLLGVLTDEKNSLGFILSAPSPLTGIVMKLPNYRKLDLAFMDAVKINTSLGRVNGDKWK